jgi:hypothetical protein
VSNGRESKEVVIGARPIERVLAKPAATSQPVQKVDPTTGEIKRAA